MWRCCASSFLRSSLIASETNGGYPYGNNLGLGALGFHGAGQVDTDAPRYALLLNPDTEVPPDALYQMIQYMDAHPKIGVAGSEAGSAGWQPGFSLPSKFPDAAGLALSFFGIVQAVPEAPGVRAL